MLRKIAFAVAFLTMFGSLVLAAPAEPNTPNENQGPTQRTGQFFRWAEPTGWHSYENQMCVQIAAPDGLTLAAYSETPAVSELTCKQVLKNLLDRANLQDAQTLSERDLGYGGVEMLITFVLNGRQMEGDLVCVPSARGGMMVAGYQAPLENFRRDDLMLRAIAGSIVPLRTGASPVQGRDRNDAQEPAPNNGNFCGNANSSIRINIWRR